MTAKHSIVLGNGRRIPLGAYVQGIQAVIAAPPDRVYRHGLCGWASATAAEIVAEWQDSVHDRINKHDPTYGRGRKWSVEWQWDVRRAARDLNSSARVYASTLPLWLRARMAHRTCNSWED